MNTHLITWEKMRMIFVAGISPILGKLTPTKGFVTALVIMFAFNIWAGMRADGVSILRCKPFKFSKFKNALAELFLYLLIDELVFTVMSHCGDTEEALFVVKSLTYVFMIVYLQNACRNLVIAYPQYPALHILYHLVRLEFTRMLPEHWRPIVERYKNKPTDESQ